jgi:hypothetical protein
MLVTDPILIAWIDANAHWLHEFDIGPLAISVAGVIGAVLVILVGKMMAAKPPGEPGAPAEIVDLAAEEQQPKVTR